MLAELEKFIYDPTLVLYLPLRELDAGKTPGYFTSRDHYGHLVTRRGAIWTPSGCYFNGTDDWLDCGDHASLNFGSGVFSLMGRFKTATISKDLLMKGGGGSGGKYYRLAFDVGGRLFFAIDDDNTSKTISSTTRYTDGNWHTYLAVRNLTTLELYVDRNLVATPTDITSYGDLDQAHSLLIGCNYNHQHSTRDLYFIGHQSEVLFMSRVVSPVEMPDFGGI